MDRPDAISDEPADQRPVFVPDRSRSAGSRLRVLIILGHPRVDSLSGALARAYRTGAVAAGTEVRELRVADLDFEPDVTAASILAQTLEPDLCRAQAAIAWADHLVFVYPTWWGTMPAGLKALLDRILLPGFAFARRADGGGFVPLLGGRTAELVTTMDTPRFVYRWLFKAPGHHAMKHATLGFCGIETTRISSFGPVDASSPAKRESWLNAAERHGRALARGPRPPLRAAGRKLGGYLRALRLQFHPMAWVAYALGALAAASITGSFDGNVFWLGLGFLFLLEFATVLSNEYHDFESDRRNRNFGPFTGGSRVLVDKRLSPSEVRRATLLLLGLAGLTAALVMASAATPVRVVAASLLALTVLAVGYTAPPLKLCYRGLGEVDVAVTHSVAVIVLGFVLQGGAWSSPTAWLLGTPLLLAVLPGIILAGVPDHDADRTVGKGTLAVRFGIQSAYRLAAVLALLAAIAALTLAQSQPFDRLFAGLGYLALPHAALLALLLERRGRHAPRAERIDGLMALALGFTVWFGAVPLINLL